MKYNIFTYFLLALLSVSCADIKNRKTTIEVVDNNRHYYPVLAGQKLDIVFPIKNTGNNPLVISDVITSCGCLVSKKSSIEAIPEGDERLLILEYNSAKNVGFVEHYITLFGNFEGTDMYEIKFDVNVVPSAHYTKDYEELYQEEKDKDGNIKSFVDGDENNKGYYMD